MSGVRAVEPAGELSVTRVEPNVAAVECSSKASRLLIESLLLVESLLFVESLLAIRSAMAFRGTLAMLDAYPFSLNRRFGCALSACSAVPVNLP